MAALLSCLLIRSGYIDSLMADAKARFSLADVLVVIAVLSVLAALALPVLLRGARAANESSAIGDLGSFYHAQMTYAQMFPARGFAGDIVKLGPARGAAPDPSTKGDALDFVLHCAVQPCQKNGYLFAVDLTSGAPVDNFRITAVPAVPGKTGIRGFCLSSTGIVTYDPGGGKNCAHPI